MYVPLLQTVILELVPGYFVQMTHLKEHVILVLPTANDGLGDKSVELT